MTTRVRVPHPQSAAPDAGRLRVKVFADGANLGEFRALRANPLISGFTTNPTLMRRAGVEDYRAFARAVLDEIRDQPVSLEVVADEFGEMERQAVELASWGPNVFVKIPITNSHGESSAPLLERLARQGVQVNVTAMTTAEQARVAARALVGGPAGILSIFAGRIADTGRDPVPVIRAVRRIATRAGNLQVLWASPRELLNIFQADEAGCDIITVTADLLAKLNLVGKDLDVFSLETVRMFLNDAVRSGYRI